MDLETDTGTVVPRTEAAIVTVNGMTGLELLIPKMAPEDTVPDLALLLTALLIRCDKDPDFVREQLDWMDNHRS